MTEFFAALAVFVGAHMIPAVPGLRSSLVARFGRTSYLALYSLSSVVLLAWLIVAAQRAETILLWDPAPWQWWVPLIAMPLAACLVITGLCETNPLSISLRPHTNGQPLGPGTAIARHPILWGFLIWAVSHIPPNGDLVALILFGGMALLAVAGMLLLDAKARRRLGPEKWARLARQTSTVPFAAILTGRAPLPPARKLALTAALAIALYGWFVLAGHQALIGIDPTAGI
jgi:uncharacterized membrane protein